MVVVNGTLAAVFQTCAFYSPRTSVLLGAPRGGKGAVCLDNVLRRNRDLGKERKQPTKQRGPFLPLGGVEHIAQHTWEGDPAWGQ